MMDLKQWFKKLNIKTQFYVQDLVQLGIVRYKVISIQLNMFIEPPYNIQLTIHFLI